VEDLVVDLLEGRKWVREEEVLAVPRVEDLVVDLLEGHLEGVLIRTN
jgi:hypothetical protein